MFVHLLKFMDTRLVGIPSKRRRAQLDGRRAIACADIRPLPGWCIFLFEARGAKSFTNDMFEDRGVVITRTVSLRLVWSMPQDLSIRPPGSRTSNQSRRHGAP